LVIKQDVYATLQQKIELKPWHTKTSGNQQFGFATTYVLP